MLGGVAGVRSNAAPMPMPLFVGIICRVSGIHRQQGLR